MYQVSLFDGFASRLHASKPTAKAILSDRPDRPVSRSEKSVFVRLGSCSFVPSSYGIEYNCSVSYRSGTSKPLHSNRIMSLPMQDCVVLFVSFSAGSCQLEICPLTPIRAIH